MDLEDFEVIIHSPISMDDDEINLLIEDVLVDAFSDDCEDVAKRIRISIARRIPLDDYTIEVHVESFMVEVRIDVR